MADPTPTPTPTPTATVRSLNVPGWSLVTAAVIVGVSLVGRAYLQSGAPRPATAVNWRTQGKEYGAYLCLSAAVSLENGARAARATKDLAKGRDAAKADFRLCLDKSWDTTLRAGLDAVYPPGSTEPPTTAQIETYATALEEVGKGLRDKIGWTKVDASKIK